MKSKAEVKTISCDNLHIAAMIESELCTERETYFASNYLVMVECGVYTLETEDQTYVINEGEFALIRKYTLGKIKKTRREDQKAFKDTVFVLQDDFIKEVIRDFKAPENILPCTESVVKYQDNYILEGLRQSLAVYFKGTEEIDRDLIHLKTKEAIAGILKGNKNLIHIFNSFSVQQKADLYLYMEHNYMYNLPLETFAKNAGRSLSAFNRDFRELFHTTPSKWLKKKRLNLAKELITLFSRKPSDVYLEVGFEDLSHFSRSFKSEFGINPSEMASA